MQDDDEGPQSGPHRLCAATREVKPLEELLRFVVGPGNQLVPDLKRRLPGRGVWVTATGAAVREAVRRKAFARSLKAPVTVSPTLVEDVALLLARAARESLSLANKAGQVVSGFSKVEAAIGGGPVEAVLQASDAAADGARKIGQALRRRKAATGNEIPVLHGLESLEMGLALGRSHVIHAALMKGSASRACVARFRALGRYRDEKPATVPIAGHPTDTTTEDADEHAGNDPGPDPRTR